MCCQWYFGYLIIPSSTKTVLPELGSSKIKWNSAHVIAQIVYILCLLASLSRSSHSFSRIHGRVTDFAHSGYLKSQFCHCFSFGHLCTTHQCGGSTFPFFSPAISCVFSGALLVHTVTVIGRYTGYSIDIIHMHFYMLLFYILGTWVSLIHFLYLSFG